MDDLNLDLNNREIRGKKVANLRRSGITPVHLYGDKTNSLSLQCDTQTLNKIIPEAGRNIPIHVTLPGEDNASVCFVREVQHHPVTDEIIHVDFLKVNVSSTVRTEVPVTVDGVSPAVRNLGGHYCNHYKLLRLKPSQCPFQLGSHYVRNYWWTLTSTCTLKILRYPLV